LFLWTVKIIYSIFPSIFFDIYWCVNCKYYSQLFCLINKFNFQIITYKLINIYYYLYFSSDNSDIASRIPKIADKFEESGSSVFVSKIVCTENNLDDPYDKKKLSVISISSSSSSSDSNSSDSETDNSSGKIYWNKYSHLNSMKLILLLYHYIITLDLDEEENVRAEKKWLENIQSIENNFYTIKEMLVTYTYYISLSI